MQQDEQEIARWEGEGGLSVPSDSSERMEYARQDVQGNQYDIRSQKVRK
jgi:hypothetical protein